MENAFAQPGAPPKQFRSLGGRTLLEWSVDLLKNSGCDPVIVVLPEGSDPALVPAGVEVRPGGDTRQASVWSGLQIVTSDRVVVHDGARPFASPTLVHRTLDALDHHDAAVAAIPVDETLKLVSGEDIVTTIDRSGLWAIQTPQAFHTSILRDAHERANTDDYIATDDAGLVERYGGRVCVIRGARTNLKLTYPEDFELAEGLLKAGIAVIRIGQGYDVHQIDDSRRLVLAGVEIPDHPGLAGHSDADVVCHTIGDALLGAAGLGDLGARFPATEEWMDASSLRILEEVARTLRSEGWEISNVDSTVIAQSPKLAPFRDRMVDSVSQALSVERSRVSIKATTTDGLGFTGTGRGMAAIAVALVTSA